jgi:hypothetical protein
MFQLKNAHKHAKKLVLKGAAGTKLQAANLNQVFPVADSVQEVIRICKEI